MNDFPEQLRLFLEWVEKRGVVLCEERWNEYFDDFEYIEMSNGKIDNLIERFLSNG